MKAQVSAEFVIIFVFLLTALIIGLVVNFNKTYEVTYSRIKLEADQILTKAANSINTVYLEGSGFATNLTLPETLLGLNYSLSIRDNQLKLSYSNIIYSKSLLTRNITGNITPGPNTVSNLEGEIVII